MCEEIIFEVNISDIGSARLLLPSIKLPTGRFLMGSLHGLPFAPEEPVHEVTLAGSIAITKYAITQAQYCAVMGNSPAQFTDYATAPVETVTWLEAKQFCEQLSTLLQRVVRLPSEAEWEYACRGGTTTEYFFGDGTSALPEYAWFDYNSAERTQPVGLKKPNPWGLCDMAGNVWEWCEDVWHGSYNGAPQDGCAWLTTEQRQSRRVVRGAAWNMDAFRCRSSYRSYDWQDAATNRPGFRVVVDV